MLQGRNFTLIPYISESGNIQIRLSKSNLRSRRGYRTIRPGAPSWAISSQVKYGRDGQAYALHQLHSQARGAIVARMKSQRGEKTEIPKRRGSGRYVQPIVVVQEDLRVSGGGMGFVSRIENALILGRAKGEGVSVGPGMVVKTDIEWLDKSAANMNAEWNRVSEFLPRYTIVRKSKPRYRRTQTLGRDYRRKRTA